MAATRRWPVVAEAPGRVNLIGEHTDYNGGFVLPTVIPRRTRVTLVPRTDRKVGVWSANIGAEGERQDYLLGQETPGRGWVDYVQGITWALRDEGYTLGGFEAAISSTLPLGSGLASSAALEVSLLRAVREAFGLELDDLRLALIARRAENEFVGARVGVMDQMVASLGEAGSALFIDTRSLEHRRVPLPAAAELVVVDSGLAHGHAGGEYNRRRQECEQACRALGVALLRDVARDDLPRLQSLPEPLGRRARHVVTENERVVRAVAALEAGDLVELGRLFSASHASMRDDYEVSLPEIDLLVALAEREVDVYGARLTGGGFGGAVVILARAGTGAEVAARVARGYRERTGLEARVLVPEGS